MVNSFQFTNLNFNVQLINLSLILNCPNVPNLRNETVGHSSINVSLTYLRSLEVPELKEEDIPVILSKIKFCLTQKSQSLP